MIHFDLHFFLNTDCGATDVTPNTTYSSNPQKYRILSKFGDSIYIGGLQEVIRINPGCPSGNETDPWMTVGIHKLNSCSFIFQPFADSIFYIFDLPPQTFTTVKDFFFFFFFCYRTNTPKQ